MDLILCLEGSGVRFVCYVNGFDFGVIFRLGFWFLVWFVCWYWCLCVFCRWLGCLGWID